MNTISELLNLVRIPSTNADEWWEEGFFFSGSRVLRIWNHRIGKVTWKFFLKEKEWVRVRNKFKDPSIKFHVTHLGKEEYWFEISQPSMLIYHIIKFITKIR